jgi:hypothetical protein
VLGQLKSGSKLPHSKRFANSVASVYSFWTGLEQPALLWGHFNLQFDVPKSRLPKAPGLVDSSFHVISVGGRTRLLKAILLWKKGNVVGNHT